MHLPLDEQTSLLYTGRSLSTHSKVVTATSIFPKGICKIKSISNCKCYSKCINSFEITCIVVHNFQVRENACGKIVILKHLSCRAIGSLHFDISGILDCAGCSSHGQKICSDPRGDYLTLDSFFQLSMTHCKALKGQKEGLVKTGDFPTIYHAFECTQYLNLTWYNGTMHSILLPEWIFKK